MSFECACVRACVRARARVYRVCVCVSVCVCVCVCVCHTVIRLFSDRKNIVQFDIKIFCFMYTHHFGLPPFACLGSDKSLLLK